MEQKILHFADVWTEEFQSSLRCLLLDRVSSERKSHFKDVYCTLPPRAGLAFLIEILAPLRPRSLIWCVATSSL